MTLARLPVAESRLLRQCRERRVQVMAAEFDLRPHFQGISDRARRTGNCESPVQDHERVLEAAANLVGRSAHGCRLA
jgi:hypothetical protein